MSILKGEYRSNKWNECILIRNMQREDYPIMHKWLNDPLVLKYYEEPPSSLDAIRLKFNQRIEGNHYVRPFIIDYEDKAIGYIQFYEIQEEKRIEYGFDEERNMYGIDQFIGETKMWGLGIGTYMILKMLELLKRERSASRVLLEVKKTNMRAIACYKKCGFVIVKELTPEMLLMQRVL
ncbi:acetyltransferase [Fictibacillus nanhaiensis]|nr:acetyltransferase [Fictibacillus nanhaiensis]